MSQLEAGGGDGLVTGITFIMRPRNKFTSLFNINNTAEPSWAWTEKSSGPCLKCISRMLTTRKVTLLDHCSSVQSSFSSLSIASSSSVRSESMLPISWRTSPADLKLEKV